MSTLKPILEEVKRELTEKDKIRETTHENMRKATSLSKRAILLVHQKKQEEAEKLIENARNIILELQGLAKEHPDIIYGGMFSAALQEYAEANIFLTLIKESRFVTPREINVPSVDYALGLADVIGEYRRAVLDALREGDAEKGEEYLKVMDEVYVELMALDEAYMLVPGLRRKCDVARKIIETTRGDVTQEVRRKALEDYLKQFECVRKKVNR
ncbi:MAG: haloacid dehalogenase [Candidatus Bathyarchaeota archaeon]|nr:haloacid dehalogenase [Candidatus Bathyarchaeota archaeon]